MEKIFVLSNNRSPIGRMYVHLHTRISNNVNKIKENFKVY